MDKNEEAEMNTGDTDRLILRRDLQATMDVCSETIRRWMASGKLPEPDVQLTRRTMGWRLSTLRAHGINLA